MKIKEGYILRTVAGENIVVCVNGNADFKGAIMLNETGAFLWQQLSEEKNREQLVEAILKEYDVERERAISGIDAFLDKMSQNNLIDL